MSVDANNNWTQNPDAKVWTEKWAEEIKKNPNIPFDPETMIGWFANAIMCGYDAGRKDVRRLAKEHCLKLVSDIENLW